MESTLHITTQTIENKKDTFIVAFEGILDTATAPELHSYTLEFFKKPLEKNFTLIVDCQKLSYINSIGLTRLMNLYREANRRSGRLKLVNVSGNIMEVLSVLGAAKLLKIYSSVQKALE